MKILIVSQNHRSSYVGGNEVYADALATELANRGHQVTYLAVSGRSGGQNYRLSISGGWSFGKYVLPKPNWFQAIKRFQPDIVHAAGSGVAVTLTGLYCRLFKIKCLLTFQAPQRKTIVGQIDEWLLTRGYDRFITTSVENETYLKQKTNKPVDTVWLSLKPGFKPMRRFKRPTKSKNVLMVAKLDQHHYYKGVEVAIQAMSLLPQNYRLLLAGDGPLKVEYEAMAKGLGLADRVVFLGYVPDKQLPRYYRQAWVFILPSTSQSEGFGLVLLEAMACGTPVVTTSCVGIATYFKKHKLAKIIKSKNAVDLANAIRNPLVSKKQVQAACDFAVSRTAEAMTKETEMVYEK